MKATGIVRRIDDLGRVVIPKEIRRTMGIREGDPLEIYTGERGEIFFKKYAPSNTNDVVVYLVNSARALGFDIGVYDDLGAYHGGSRMGSTNGRIDIEAERGNLVAVADEGVYERAFLFIKITKDSPKATIESIKALAQMACVMLNEG